MSMSKSDKCGGNCCKKSEEGKTSNVAKFATTAGLTAAFVAKRVSSDTVGSIGFGLLVYALVKRL